MPKYVHNIKLNTRKLRKQCRYTKREKTKEKEKANT